MYLVSPQLLVTREHIMSDSASTSSPRLSFALGVATLLGGLEAEACPLKVTGLWCEVEEDRRSSLTEPLAPWEEGLLLPIDRSASLFSSVPRSVLPSSSSEISPESLSRDSMRPRRFSKPSMYLALCARAL